MSNYIISIENLSLQNIDILTTMSVELWPECIYEEELAAWNEIRKSPNNYCALAKINNDYAGFIHISIREDYVEGSVTNETPYLEAIYVREKYRNKHVAKQLLIHSETWIKQKGFSQLASDTAITNLDSQQFHCKAGFTEVNKIVCYIKNLQ